MKKIYFDMDGVLVDFSGHYLACFGSEDPPYGENEEAFAANIRSNAAFFAEIPPLPMGITLFNAMLPWKPQVLTALCPYAPNCKAQKLEMLQKYLGLPESAVHATENPQEKVNFCKPGDILIDDNRKTCKAWLEAGGIAFNVKFTGDKTTDFFVGSTLLKELMEIVPRVLYIMRGIPGSGKSTFVKNMLTVARIASADDFFTRNDGTYVFDQTKLAAAHNYSKTSCEFWMKANAPLIAVDNTNILPEHIRPYLDLAAQYNYEVCIVRMDCSPEVGVFRNVHGVPSEHITKMAENIKPVPGEQVIKTYVSVTKVGA